ncbi:MAG: response regulator [Burkholderiales bacterium]|nr:response regulator [Burkholderiales bacterium]
MNSSPAAARILVATDNADDARQIVRQLEAVFSDVRASTAADTSVADFEACKPEVLVLAFDSLEKSERYYLGLYRQNAGGIQVPHRTVVLCNRLEVSAAFALCQRSYFDDYVLFWPQSFDGARLAMSVWIASRQASTPADPRPSTAQLLLHASHLAELERVVGEPEGPAQQSLRERIRPALEGTRPLGLAVRCLKPLVLVIDDDEFARMLVQQALDPALWDVAFAVDGATALAQLARIKADVILMDVRLPDVDGVALTRRLKAAPSTAGVPILMLTGDSRRETLLGSMEAGAAGFVVKPVSRATLQAKLDKILPR